MIGYGFSGHSAPMCAHVRPQFASCLMVTLWSLCHIVPQQCQNFATLCHIHRTVVLAWPTAATTNNLEDFGRRSTDSTVECSAFYTVLLRTPIVASPNWAELQCGGRAWHVMDIGILKVLLPYHISWYIHTIYHGILMLHSCYTHVTHADFRFREDDYSDLPRAIDAPWPYAMKDRTDICARARVRGTVPWLWEILGMESRIQALSHQLTSSNPSLYIPFISTFLPLVNLCNKRSPMSLILQISLCHDNDIQMISMIPDIHVLSCSNMFYL